MSIEFDGNFLIGLECAFLVVGQESLGGYDTVAKRCQFVERARVSLVTDNHTGCNREQVGTVRPLLPLLAERIVTSTGGERYVAVQCVLKRFVQALADET